MGTLKEEILSLKETFKQLELESILFQHLQIQEDYYLITFRPFIIKIEQMIKQQEEQIDTLLRQKCYLEARILGLNDEGAILQYQWGFLILLPYLS